MIGKLEFRSCLIALLTAPLFVACGSSDGDSKNDAATGTDAPVVADAPVGIDAPAVVPDAGAGDVPVVPDAAVADTAGPDASDGGAADVAPVEAGPVVPCTMTKPFTGDSVVQDLTLTLACSPYTITKDIRVEDNATLTIEPGVVLKFGKDVGLVVGYDGAGKVVAEGTPTKPILFTSSAATPTAGDWDGVDFYADSMTGNKFAYATFEYCGKTNAGCIVGESSVKPSAVTITNVTFDKVGANSTGIREKGEGRSFAITNTVFPVGAIKTGYAIVLDATSFAAIGTGNVFNGAAINLVGGTIEENATWINPGTPIVVTGDLRVEGTASPVLTVAAGTIMKFASDTHIWVGYSGAGQLVAVGTATAPITLTSNQATPGRGDWEGIKLYSNTANGTKLAYVNLDYCGQNDDGCIVVDRVASDRVTLDHLIIDHVGAKANGIVENGADVRAVITNSTFPAGAIQSGKYAIRVDAASFAAIGAGNVFNGALIEIVGGTIESGKVSWVNPGTIIAVTDELRVEGTDTPELAIGAGMTFKFGADGRIWVGYSDPGKLVVAGTATSRVKFTSLATTPGKGDWRGIVVWGDGQADISYADIEYAGAAERGALESNSNDTKVTLANSTISNSAGFGVYIDCDNSTTTVGATNTYTGNAGADMGPVCD